MLYFSRCRDAISNLKFRVRVGPVAASLPSTLSLTSLRWNTLCIPYYTLLHTTDILYIFLILGEQLVLYGNLSVLGLLVLKHHSRRPKSTDYSVYKFVQAVVRFLWDAHNTDESDSDEYSVSQNYLPFWSDLIDLWYLGMQVLSSLLPQVLVYYIFRD